MKKDYYSILQVSSKDSLSKIKNQYKKLSLKYHPDKNKTKEASEKFILINEAYDVLKDDYKRGRYDVEYEKYNNPFQNMMNIFNNMDFFKNKNINKKSFIKSHSIQKKMVDGEIFIKEKMIEDKNGEIKKTTNYCKIDKNGKKILYLK